MIADQVRNIRAQQPIDWWALAGCLAAFALLVWWIGGGRW